MTSIERLPLPTDPTLAAHASVLNELGHWAIFFDARWRVVFVTDERRLSNGDEGASSGFGVGEHWFGPAELSRRRALYEDGLETVRENFRHLGPFVLFDTPGGRDELRRVVDPALHDLVDRLDAVEPPVVWREPEATIKHAGSGARTSNLYQRVQDDAGAFVGIIYLSKPRPGMSQLATGAAMADLGHLDRMALVERPARRPAAVLMADLEASSPLARRLSTSQYFAFGRRLVRVADQCIIDHGGIVGRHAGDGVVAFFLAETSGSESAAARSCIEAARALRAAVADLTLRSGLEEDAVSLRFGLHWGATLYVGRITTVGRSEVTALGDEVNESARIEACASGGRMIASKPLIEHLGAADARGLGIDLDRAAYTPLADLATATDKARRDAPSIAVCDLA